MRRGSNSRSTRKLIETIQRDNPGLALRTTLMVGYPAETDRAFEELYEFVRQTRFHRLGVFQYSREDGTAAEVLGDPIPAAVKEQRANALMELQKKISETRNEELIGTTRRVLVDREENGVFVGRTEWDAPEIDQEVFISSPPILPVGNFFDVRIVDGTEYDLTGELVQPPEPRGDQ
jgi:ribosomal protein S12 methylthiotransferase